MESPNVATYRAGHEAFNERDFVAMTKQFTLPLCEMWHFDSSGQVVGGDLYYDQVSLLTQLGLMPQPS